MEFYRISGLSVASEIVLPGLIAGAPSVSPEVTIRRGEVLGVAGLVMLGFRRRWLETLCLATPIVLVTLVGAATLAAPRRNEILMTLIFPLAGFALSATATALSSGRKWSP